MNHYGSFSSFIELATYFPVVHDVKVRSLKWRRVNSTGMDTHCLVCYERFGMTLRMVRFILLTTDFLVTNDTEVYVITLRRIDSIISCDTKLCDIKSSKGRIGGLNKDF